MATPGAEADFPPEAGVGWPPDVGAFTTSPQKEGAAVVVVFVQGLAASAVAAGAEEADQDKGCEPGGPFHMAACAKVIDDDDDEGGESKREEAVCAPRRSK